jgi:hypothetical protein
MSVGTDTRCSRRPRPWSAIGQANFVVQPTFQVACAIAFERLAERHRALEPELAGQLLVAEQQLPVRLHLPDRLRVAG